MHAQMAGQIAFLSESAKACTALERFLATVNTGMIDQSALLGESFAAQFALELLFITSSAAAAIHRIHDVAIRRLQNAAR